MFPEATLLKKRVEKILKIRHEETNSVSAFQVSIKKTNLFLWNWPFFGENNVRVTEHFFSSKITIWRYTGGLVIFKKEIKIKKGTKSNSSWILLVIVLFQSFKHQPQKMAQHTQTFRRQLPTNFLSLFDHFMGLALKGLITKVIIYEIIFFHISLHFQSPVKLCDKCSSQKLKSCSIFCYGVNYCCVTKRKKYAVQIWK